LPGPLSAEGRTLCRMTDTTKSRPGAGPDDVVQAAMERSRWLEDLLGQAAQQLTISQQATASVQQYILDRLNAAGGSRTVTFEQRDDLISNEQRQQALAAQDARTAVLAQIKDRLCHGPDDERRAAAIFLLATGHWWWDAGWGYRSAAEAGGWSAAELKAVMRLLLAGNHLRYEDIELLGTWAAVIERLAEPDRRQLIPELHTAAAQISGSLPGIAVRGRVLSRITRMLRELDPATIPDGLLVPRDNWAPPLLEIAAGDLAGLIVHLSSLSGPRPSKTWRSECLQLLNSKRAREFVRAGLRGLAECEPATVTAAYNHQEYRSIVCEQNSRLARGVVWAAALLAGNGAASRLAAVALRAGETRRDIAQELKVAGAAINALGESADAPALEGLWLLRDRIRDRSLRKQLDLAAEAAARRHGITPAELVERSVPDHGLGPDGSLSREVGEYAAAVTIEGCRSARLTFRAADGRIARSVPAAVAGQFPSETAELKSLVKQVRSTLAAECRRLESVLATSRSWPLETWQRYYLNHPVTGVITSQLIWELETPAGERTSALPGPDGLAGADGQPLTALPGATRVRPWHPAGADAAQVGQWRSAAVDRQLRQPFKQAFREVYRLTPAEAETASYSNRFAAHILDYPQLYALLVQRGWQSNYLGAYDGGDDGDASVELMDGQWRAHFRFESVDPGQGAQVALAATDQVRFERRDGRGWEEAPLRDVPPLVFSEAMRDVDLFVSVTSIGVDPEWSDRGADRYRAYWRSFASAELTPSAQVRRAALDRLVPKLKIADRCTLTDRYLEVRGRLRTYKIHIGSASVLMEPGSTYLCIVSAHGQGRERMFLPFEEDGRLALILSKAFLLADDEKITDETIRRQLILDA
jgi:hypothetical protein